MGRRGRPAPYDAVAYRTPPYPACHPDRMAAVARLHRVAAADPERCRYVDLACGDGGNLLAVAATLPRAACAGVDAGAAAIARGRAIRDAAGLERVELRVGDLRERRAAEGLAPADYVVVHGLLSWVDEEVRDAAFALAAELLAPAGVLLVSYNALPGWDLLRPARALARRVAGSGGPEERAEAAREALALALELHGADDAYGRALAQAAERYARTDPAVLFHDDMAERCEPLALAEVALLAERHGLAYLDEALPEQWWRWRLPGFRAERLRAAAAPHALARQELADAASGAAFKASLFVRAEVGATGDAEPDAALDLCLAPAGPRADGAPAPVGEGDAPAVRGLAAALAGDPTGTTVRELAARARVSEPAAAAAALRLVAERRADLCTRPLAIPAQAGARPRAPALARAQAREGTAVATLRHEPADLGDPLIRELIQLMDGGRDRRALAEALAARAPELGAADVTAEQLEAALDTQLDELARLGLVLPETSA